CIEASTCRDRICVGTGWLTKPGQSAVCLPNRVVVKIIGSNQEYDIISQ
ncbi:MAG: NusG domain II-containing protein, partial [Clostridiales bacterium]|nr:NusG domain II-containing protein [Clostridiales bacterium]